MISLALLSLSMVLTVMGDSWGPAYSLGPTNSAIIEATTTFNPGTPPSNPQNYLFLWPGISNSTSGLIQSGADSTADQSGYCGASSDQWCVMASYFGVVDGATTQLNGDMVPVDANTDITINYKLGDDQVTWTQTVTVNGEVISTLESYDGPLYNGGWGTGTECQSDCTGSTSPQYYTDTTIILMEADADFSSTLGIGSGVEASDMVTTDNGKTWTIASITIPAMIDDGSSSSSSTAAAFAASSDVPSSSVSGDTSGHILTPRSLLERLLVFLVPLKGRPPRSAAQARNPPPRPTLVAEDSPAHLVTQTLPSPVIMDSAEEEDTVDLRALETAHLAGREGQARIPPRP
ncbi:hypothetical protein BDZ89DRAFT_557186 [Hymenopellis radicata]|nr:hypothetical protein BDZ89DRAFT_557186 [Hymenopellis radicata]